MQELVASGHVVDLILALVVLEAIALLAWHRATGRGIAPRALAFNLLAGVALMLAVRGALVGAAWTWIAASLAAAGLAHVADLATRWHRQ